MLLYEKGLDLLELEHVTTNINVGLCFLKAAFYVALLTQIIAQTRYSLNRSHVSYTYRMYIVEGKIECYFGFLCDVYNIWKTNKLGMNQAENEEVFLAVCVYSRLVHIYKATCNLYICKIFFLTIFLVWRDINLKVTHAH